jgi:hypothetical protein
MIYESIIGKHPGVANYEFGDDVVFPGHGDHLISVKNLHDENWSNAENTAVTPVLHRLLVSTYGRPLWDFESELELLKGLRAALKRCVFWHCYILIFLKLSIGHQFLYGPAILHCDIGAGNVLLASEQCTPEGREGFVMDIEFAHHADSFLHTGVKTVTVVNPIHGPGGMTAPSQRTHIKFGTVSVKRGAAMTVSFIYLMLFTQLEYFPGNSAIHGLAHFASYAV